MDDTILTRNLSAIIIIDPQRGFADAHGSLAKAFGESELIDIQRANREIELLPSRLEARVPILLVTSHYSPNQFSDGDSNSPLGKLCVPGTGIDCELSLPPSFHSRCEFFVKNQKSAMSCPGFRERVVQLERQGVTHFLLCGFLYTSCVAETALEMCSALGPATKVSVI